VSDELDFIDAEGHAHSLKLLEHNVINNLNGYVCSCGRLFITPHVRVAKIDHCCWGEYKKVEDKPTCVYRLRREYF
jgi:hypothetical protein